MKKSTKIIGAVILLATGLAVFLMNKKKTTSGNQYLDDEISGTTSISFNPKAIADTLYDSVKELGTDEDLIFDTLSSVSENQFGKVIKAFGLKPYNKTTGNTRFLPFTTITKFGLKTILYNELDARRYTTLKNKYPKYL